MTLNDFEALEEELWTDVEETADAPQHRPLLAHYTSAANFELIVRNEELWLSHPFYMNDHEELRWGVEHGAAALRRSAALRAACIEGDIFFSLIQAFDRQVASFERDHLLDTYVLCFSAHEKSDHDGRLSMWRGYGADAAGVCVVFDLSGLAQDDKSPFILSPVEYRATNEREAWIDGALHKVARFIVNSDRSENTLEKAARLLFDRLVVAALFSKHRGFEEEREWRAVYMKDRDSEARLKAMYGSAIGVHGLQPKLKLKLRADSDVLREGRSLASLIDRIIIGPTQAGRLAKQSMERMLVALGHQQLVSKIHQSTIPYRP